MAKKKKKPDSPPPPPKPGPFNAPFAALKEALAPPEPPPPPQAKAPAALVAPAAPPPELDEDELFARAMAGVQALSTQGRREAVAAPPRPLLDRAPDEDLEVLAQLADLVGGGGEFDLRYSDEYVTGSLPGVGPELLERLARGDFPVQDYLDLHGFSRDDALQAVEDFLVRSITKGLRHVLIVHGKGSGSPEGVPVLKRALAIRLCHKRLRKRVLAFCTARQMDGGEGAMYILLRKWQGAGWMR